MFLGPTMALIGTMITDGGMMIDRHAKRDLLQTVVKAVLVLLFLGAITSVSGCDLAYQPNCINNCNGPVGDDSYTKGAL